MIQSRSPSFYSVFWFTAICTLIDFHTAAQAPAEFEVASVRPNKADDHLVTINVGPGGTFAARGYTLVLLIQKAYGVMDWNVSGGPAWIRTDRFDIVAKASVGGDLSDRQLRPMLQRLLAERFKLKLHNSSREMSGYVLVVDRGGPRFGPGLKAVDGEERPDTFRMNSAGIIAHGLSMEMFTRFVGGKFGVVMVDQTGLSGLYDFKLEWKVEKADTPVKPNQSESPLPNEDTRDTIRSAAFAALQQQLGLRFTPRRVRVPMLVVDHAERASASEN